MEFIKTEKGKDMIIYDDHSYTKHKPLKNNIIVWECTEKRQKNCLAKLKTLNGNFDSTLNAHCHQPDVEKLNIRRLSSTVRNRATTTEEQPQNIIGNSLADASFDEGTRARMPSASAMTRNINRQRQAAFPKPPIPQLDETNFLIPYEYTTTRGGDLFLQFDNNDDNRLMIFGTRASLDFLQITPDWYMDGTFKVTPPQFKQLYTIHGIRNGAHAVGAYALLPDKRETTYVEMLSELQTLTNNVSPNTIMTDFERAAMNAFNTVYPQTEQSSCLFHLSRNIFKHIQESGLQADYNHNVNDVKTNLRMLSALAFVPEADVEQSFVSIQQHCGRAERPVLDYFESTYIGTYRRVEQPHRGRNRPRFSKEIWSMHDRLQMGLPRTNNHLEGWHNGFAKRFKQTHPDIWKFIDTLRIENAVQEMNIAQIRAGRNPKKQGAMYTTVTESLDNIVADYPNQNILDYLRNIG